MKQFSLILFFSIFSFTLFSQKVKIGPELGLNLIPIENENLGRNFQIGFHLGTQLKFNISNHFKISTGIFLTQKKKMYTKNDTSSVFELFGDFSQFVGVSQQELDSIIASTGANTDVTKETKGVVSELFIKIPILANYKYKNLNLYMGPYAGFLIMANQKEETRTQIPLLSVFDVSQFDTTGFASFFLPPADETSTNNNSGTRGLNKLDIGISVGLGYEINNLHFNLMYSQGLLDYRDKDIQGKEKKSALSTFRFSITYLFDLKSNKESKARLN